MTFILCIRIIRLQAYLGLLTPAKLGLVSTYQCASCNSHPTCVQASSISFPKHPPLPTSMRSTLCRRALRRYATCFPSVCWCSRQTRIQLCRRRVSRRGPCVQRWRCSPPRSTASFRRRVCCNGKLQIERWWCILQTCTFRMRRAWCRHRVLLHELCSLPPCTLSSCHRRACSTGLWL